MSGIRQAPSLVVIAIVVLGCQGQVVAPSNSIAVTATPVSTVAPTPAPSGTPASLPTATLAPVPSGTSAGDAAAMEAVRTVDRDRIAALVAGNVDAALPYFSMDYWLIDVSGGSWGRDDYLAAIRGGHLNYFSWDAESDVAVRLVGNTAILRYRASIVIEDHNLKIPGDFWHTDYYERVDGKWLVVWSQATPIG